MDKDKKKKSSLKWILILIALAAVAVAVYFIFFFSPSKQDTKQDPSKQTETQPATEFVITPADQEDVQKISDSLVGVWSSYTDQGVPFTYSFDKDGGVRYKKDGENPIDYTYTFEDGMLTIKNDKKSFVYQCSKDAVDMMANFDYGAWKTIYSNAAEEIEDFNGCFYIVDDFMYLGTIVLCREDALSGYDTKTIEGDWIGVSGDLLSFASDGTYTYVENNEHVSGKYEVDYDKMILTIILSKETDYDEDCWGLDGRVFHIEKQYYFKAS